MKEVQKDPIRAKRLDEVYKHLFAHFGITSQKHLAEVLKVQRTGLSSAFNGNVSNLTDNLFKKICAAFPGVFNLNYLLTGEGDLLTLEEEVHNEDYEKLYNPQPMLYWQPRMRPLPVFDENSMQRMKLSHSSVLVSLSLNVSWLLPPPATSHVTRSLLAQLKIANNLIYN